MSKLAQLDNDNITVKNSKLDKNDNFLTGVRKVFVMKSREKALKKNWRDLIEPLIQNMKLAVKYDTKNKEILLLPGYKLNKKDNHKLDSDEKNVIEAWITKALEYLKAFLLGFKIQDCMALLRFDDIYLQSFKVTDVKKLVNDNLGRAIGRITGRQGRTKDAIQNTTKTRIVIQDKNIHMLGGFENITLARDAICSLILGATPNKVHSHLGVVNRKMKERAL